MMWPTFFQCKKKGVVERDGNLYCTIHDPEYIQAKNKKLGEKWYEERKVRDDKWARESLAGEIFEDVDTETIKANVAKYKASNAMYEALKELSTIVLGVIEYHKNTPVILGMDSFTLQPARQALSKAEVK